MNKKFSVIKINGFKGLFLAIFIVGCLIAGFLIFPGWICMHVWNFIADFFSIMPVMSIVHGIMLWGIIALSLYAINKNDFLISFGTSAPVISNEDRIKDIIKQINEKNAQIIPLAKNNDKINNDSEDADSQDKLIK